MERNQDTIENLVSHLIDYRGKTPKKTLEGIPLVTAKIVKKGRILTPTEFIAEEDYVAWMRRGIPEVNDVVLTTEAPLGEVALIKDADIALAQRIITLRGKKDILDNSYLKYFLQSPIGQSKLESRQSGTTVFGIKQSELRKVEIDYPPLPEQKAIASILSAIDDKIELNLQMNKTLEDMAMALYKHWFVDFGPFQDGNFVESELGMIPEGWEVKRLGDLVDKLSKGTTPRKKDVDGLNSDVFFLKVKDISDNGTISNQNLTVIPEEVHLKHLKRSILQSGDILFSIAGTIGRVAVVTNELDNSNCNQAIAFIRLKEPIANHNYVFSYMKSKITQAKIKSSIVQGVQANVSLGVLKDLEILIPPLEQLSDFNNLVRPIRELCTGYTKESNSLIKKRDTLLPNLISGKVRLKEFRSKMEEVL